MKLQIIKELSSEVSKTQDIIEDLQVDTSKIKVVLRARHEITCGIGGVTPLLLNLSSTCRREVGFAIRLHRSQRRSR